MRLRLHSVAFARFGARLSIPALLAALIFIWGIAPTAAQAATHTAGSATPATSAPMASAIEDVSLIRLIAAPEAYHGKRVRVIGVGNLEFEGNAVYLHPDDLRHAVYSNGLWIQFETRAVSYDTAAAYNGRYVIIEGVFDMKSTGHMGLWSGSIKDITRYELWK